MRIDKFICKSTQLTRSEASTFLQAQKVCVDGKVFTNGATQVYVDNEVTLDGEILIARPSRYIMVHKPRDTLCSNIDEVYPSLFHHVGVEKAFDLHVAGRLDADTTGLVLVTDDGRWSHNIIMPDNECEKVYRVTLRDPIAEDVALQFEQGVLLRGQETLTLPAKLEIVSDHEVLLTLTQGKFQQVKRMFRAVGNRVHALHRESIGQIQLDIEVGQWRHLTLDEINLFIS
ncbi:MAG: pseudouridine synthase [Pseudomonadales bacterium]|nr:pseudouridine synthase [Pseudomonadales bacterium]